MSRFGKALMPVVVVSVITWIGCVGFVPGLDEVVVTTAGGGIGVVTSTPNGINCSSLGTGTCQSQFTNSPTVTLTATPSQGFTFGGWTGTPCQTKTSTTCTVAGAANVTATFGATLNNINHIIFIAQENRSFDNYFGALRAYWAEKSIPDQSFDGLPQLNPASGPAPNTGPTPTNPGCDPAFPDPPTTNTFCQIDANSPLVPSFHAASLCVENPSPSWGEAHRSWNVHDPMSPTPMLDGFVDAGANDARQHTDSTGAQAPFFDTNGVRVMGYYDGTDLNYYYALATAFSTSDRWFAPVMTRTPPNREYLIAGTSHGYVYQRGTNSADAALIPSTTIFEALQNAGISWKIYVNGGGATPCTDTDIQCLLRRSYIHDFVFGDTIKNNIGEYTDNPMHSIAPISEFYSDALNGTLPQVAQIEPASDLGLDEHPEDNDPAPGQPACCTIQAGANYVSTLINAVMCGQNSPPGSTCTPGKSWQDSAFIFTFDEPGGFFDHVAPQPTVNPDGIQPVDLKSNDPCFGATTPGTVCDFSYTGYRVPLVVVSPYSKKNFVSHQTRDLTAIIKLIERRFNLHTLTARDKAQVDMDDTTTGFFDFNTAPSRTPPTLPAQTVLGQSACFVDPAPTSP